MKGGIDMDMIIEIIADVIIITWLMGKLIQLTITIGLLCIIWKTIERILK